MRNAITNLDPTSFADDLSGFVLGLALWLVLLAAAPLLILVLAGLVFSIELPVLLVIAAALIVARFAGLVPWTVVVVDEATREEERERTRSFWRAVRRVREVNNEPRVLVRWIWI